MAIVSSKVTCSDKTVQCLCEPFLMLSRDGFSNHDVRAEIPSSSPEERDGAVDRRPHAPSLLECEVVIRPDVPYINGIYYQRISLLTLWSVPRVPYLPDNEGAQGLHIWRLIFRGWISVGFLIGDWRGVREGNLEFWLHPHSC